MHGPSPSFPPLLRGEEAGLGVRPMDRAIGQAVMGIDPGLVVHNNSAEMLEAAIVLAPETTLNASMAMVFAAALGFSDALGALAPPEVAVHMTWPGGFRVNGARCGGLQVAAPIDDPSKTPDWLVIGLAVPFQFHERTEPGQTVDDTTLVMEGCGEIAPLQLLESWSRHMLVWMNKWETEGKARLHTEWRGKAFDIGKDVATSLRGKTNQGTFMGLDEDGGMLLRMSYTGETVLLPLTHMLKVM